MAAMIRALAEEASVPIMLHLDHGDGLKMATRCLRAGYSSVMFDGEALPEDDNIRLTQQHAEVAHAAGASLEAAAGSFGGRGNGKRPYPNKREMLLRLTFRRTQRILLS